MAEPQEVSLVSAYAKTIQDLLDKNFWLRYYMNMAEQADDEGDLDALHEIVDDYKDWRKKNEENN